MWKLRITWITSTLFWVIGTIEAIRANLWKPALFIWVFINIQKLKIVPLFFGEIYNLFVNVAYPFAKDIASYNMAFIFASFASIFIMLVAKSPIWRSHSLLWRRKIPLDKKTIQVTQTSTLKLTTHKETYNSILFLKSVSCCYSNSPLQKWK